MASRRPKMPPDAVDLREKLIAAGLAPHFADLLDQMPSRTMIVEGRRQFREVGAPRDEVMFVRSGLLAKFKTDCSGRRQIVALRFPGEGILPRGGHPDYGIQAIVRSEVMVGAAADFDPIVDAHPEMQRFFWRLIQRNGAIGYEWLVNCGVLLGIQVPPGDEPRLLEFLENTGYSYTAEDDNPAFAMFVGPM